MATFADQIRSDLQGRVLLGIADEKRILRMGVESWGLNYGVARNELLTVAAASRVALPSDVDAAVAGFLETVATRNGLVRQADFEQAAALYRTRTGNRIGLPQARSLVKAVMISRNLQPRAAGWFWRTRSWFTSIPDAPPEPVAPVPPGQQFATQPGIAGGVPVARILGAWAAAVNARRPQAVVDLYAPGALLLATGAADPLRGAAAITGYFQRLLAYPRFAVEIDRPLDQRGVDPVVVSGLYVFSWLDELGQPVRVPSRYTFALTRATRMPNNELSGAILMQHSSALPGSPGAALL